MAAEITTRVLLDTAKGNDALACGYREPTPYDMGGLKITFEAHPLVGPCATLNGVEGEVTLTGREEIAEAIRALQMALAFGSAAQAKKAA